MNDISSLIYLDNHATTPCDGRRSDDSLFDSAVWEQLVSRIRERIGCSWIGTRSKPR